jgi:large subunit ribosomal protein L4e
MKIQVLDTKGNKTKEMETKLFEEPIREDMIYKIVESEKIKQPYAPKYLAGMNRSASGNVRHKRHSWKSDRGRGISRVPRKAFWRRGTQFSWEAAIVPQARGGRRAFPPKGVYRIRKVNRKEFNKALLSALTYVSSAEELKKKYSSIKNQDLKIRLPIIVDGSLLKLNTKDFIGSLCTILPGLENIAIPEKSVRAGIGKLRGRRFKKNAGVLVVIGKDEDKKIKGVEVLRTNELVISDLANNGARLAVFTEAAIKCLEESLINPIKRIERNPDIKKKEEKSKIKKEIAEKKEDAKPKINKEKAKKENKEDKK